MDHRLRHRLRRGRDHPGPAGLPAPRADVKKLALLALLLGLAVPWTQARIDERFGKHRAQQEVLYLWSGEQIKRMVPGFENLLADIYWLRTVQYFGGQRVYATDKRFDLLLPLVNITTTLDPRMEIAYR